jgi:hypothetical protein
LVEWSPQLEIFGRFAPRRHLVLDHPCIYTAAEKVFVIGTESAHYVFAIRTESLDALLTIEICSQVPDPARIVIRCCREHVWRAVAKAPNIHEMLVNNLSLLRYLASVHIVDGHAAGEPSRKEKIVGAICA